MDYCRIAIYVFAAYFSIVHGSLPFPVSAKDVNKGLLHCKRKLYCCIIKSHCERLYTILTFHLLPYCPLSFPGVHTLLSISSTPTLHQLGMLTVGLVASQWEELTSHFMVESCAVCKFGCGHPEETSQGALSRWLKGESDTNDVAKKTRCSVLEAHDAGGHSPLAKQLKLCSGAPVTAFAPPPGTMYVDRMCILFVI